MPKILVSLLTKLPVFRLMVLDPSENISNNYCYSQSNEGGKYMNYKVSWGIIGPWLLHLSMGAVCWGWLLQTCSKLWCGPPHFFNTHNLHLGSTVIGCGCSKNILDWKPQSCHLSASFWTMAVFPFLTVYVDHWSDSSVVLLQSRIVHLQSQDPGISF